MWVIRPTSTLIPWICRSFSVTNVNLSGHNKWSKIKQRKGAMDAKKGTIYAAASRDILVAVRNGGSTDPEKNNLLAVALKKAKAQDVPKDNIETALAKATRGKEKGDQYLTYEALAAKGSVGIIIETLTDNTNRTLHNIRSILTSHGARLGPVAFMFQRRGYVRVSLRKDETGFQIRQERLIDRALSFAAEDFDELESFRDLCEMEFTCPPSALARLTAAVASPDMTTELLASELIYAALDEGETLNEEAENEVADLVEKLEGDQDTLRVWTTLS